MVKIKSFAEANGVHAVGGFAAADFSQYLETLRARTDCHGVVYRPLSAIEKGGQIPDWVRTVVVLVMDYFVESSEVKGPRLSNYVRARWSSIGTKTAALTAFLEARGCRVEALDIPRRAAACRAGLGFIGRNTLFYAHGLGPSVRIAAIGVDAELEGFGPGEERVAHPRCENCERCVSACPVGALHPDGSRLLPSRCLSFANRHPDAPAVGMPSKLAGWLYGCEICRNVCPIDQEARREDKAESPSFAQV